MSNYVIAADPDNPRESVLVTDPDGNVSHINIGDADPEHRLVEYRLAAGWFANLPAGFARHEEALP